jgi:hypothetical protein
MQDFVELKLKQDVLARYGLPDVLYAGGQQRVNREKLSNAPLIEEKEIS